MDDGAAAKARSGAGITEVLEIIFNKARVWWVLHDRFAQYVAFEMQNCGTLVA